jgi:hypothetical protein
VHVLKEPTTGVAGSHHRVRTLTRRPSKGTEEHRRTHAVDTTPDTTLGVSPSIRAPHAVVNENIMP